MEIHPDPCVQGFLNEDRLFTLLGEAKAAGRAPDWLQSVRRASGLEDSLGVDGFALLRGPGGESLPVPFQVKSSHEGIYRCYQHYKIFWMDRLPCFVVNPLISDHRVLKVFLEELQGIRQRREAFHRVEEYLAGYDVIPPEFALLQTGLALSLPRDEEPPPTIRIAAE